MEKSNDRWNISNRLSTKTKLEILKKCFNMWLTVWNNQNWASNEWYVVDLFARRGIYTDNGKKIKEELGSGFTSSQNNDILKKMKIGDKHGQKNKSSLRRRTLSCHRSGK